MYPAFQPLLVGDRLSFRRESERASERTLIETFSYGNASQLYVGRTQRATYFIRRLSDKMFVASEL